MMITSVIFCILAGYVSVCKACAANGNFFEHVLYHVRTFDDELEVLGEKRNDICCTFHLCFHLRWNVT